ncbi:5'-nucleotidase /3'-nucleotidase /exopolyphosphatase [Thermodesulfitimonas autotrophica]|uniref:5'-nucleotidase SurE n=1 Tax=Thermodesulfitimonas autotrophica TaxID=1894989 RepID=A0A3N5BPY3_9THEO|nr:5'/3'-nucleotidase SurE [Thermodesulfitimonas autotrophica]RPF49682.1 5'-nucleotidase /3'-nucleotidase /exopolyphosphatase [Thermodesulfitimonas autotrophica]
MRILLTNDDGIFAEGISVLRKALEKTAEIYVIAPDRERSATGHSITVHRPLRVREAGFRSPRVRGWVVDGTPADCVKLGLEALLPEKPDLLIAGINLGPNVGTDVLYSGTVSAAVEGIINGIPSLAVSLATHQEPDFSWAVRFVVSFLPEFTRQVVPAGTLLNINVPPGVPRGVKITKLGNIRYVNVIDMRTDPRGRTYFWMAGEPLDLNGNDPDTDVRAVKDGFISITPVQIDLTDYLFIEKLKNWSLPWSREELLREYLPDASAGAN